MHVLYKLPMGNLEFRIPLSCSSVLSSLVTLGMWFTYRAMLISLPAVPPNSTMTESGWKHNYRMMQNRQFSLGPMNKASQEGIIGTNVFPRPSCDFIISSTTKWYFPLYGIRLLFLICE